jgi:hypothetical protein
MPRPTAWVASSALLPIAHAVSLVEPAILETASLALSTTPDTVSLAMSTAQAAASLDLSPNYLAASAVSWTLDLKLPSSDFTGLVVEDMMTLFEKTPGYAAMAAQPLENQLEIAHSVDPSGIG